MRPRLYLDSFFHKLKFKVEKAFILKSLKQMTNLQIKSELSKKKIEINNKIRDLEIECKLRQKTDNFSDAFLGLIANRFSIKN